MYIRKRNGPQIDPCGTPMKTAAPVDLLSLILTLLIFHLDKEPCTLFLIP